MTNDDAIALAKTLNAMLPRLTDEQRKNLFDIVHERYCELCGGKSPCWCAPCYDRE